MLVRNPLRPRLPLIPPLLVLSVAALALFPLAAPVAGQPQRTAGAFNYPPRPQEDQPDYFTIAEQGKARCVIVHPEGSRDLARTAAALAAWLKVVTGASFQVLSDKTAAPPDLACIHLGDTATGVKTDLKLPDLRYGSVSLPNLNGFLVHTPDPKALIVRGLTERAVNLGVASLLMRYAGVRNYWPGAPDALGAVTPRQPTLHIPRVEWRDWPLFYSRSFSTRPFPTGAHPPIDFYRRNSALPCGENYDDWLPPAKYAKTNPEYYSLVGGQRRVPADDAGAKGWQPCASNPQVQRIMAEAVIEYFRNNPNAPGVNFSINDGGGDCECAACRAMDAPGSDYSRRMGMSDRYVKFTNIICESVARSFPSKLIVFLAYASAQPAPRDVKPHPALVPVLTSPGNLFDAWDAWRSAGASAMGIYAHHDDCFFVLPKLDLRQMTKRIRYAADSGLATVFYMELHAQWPFNDHFAWVVSQLLWDPRQDEQKLLDDYYAGFYGPAAPHVKTFHQAIEAGYERWLNEEGLPHAHGKDISSIRYGFAWDQFRVLTPEEAAPAAAALERAVAAAPQGAPAERLRILSAQFRAQRLGSLYYWTAQRLKTAQARSEEDASRVVESARSMSVVAQEMSRHITEVIEKPPMKAINLLQQTNRPNPIYDEMKSGQFGPEVMACIGAGVDAAVEGLKTTLGPQKSAAWWRAASKEEKNPSLASLFESAALRASGAEIKNLVEDPGFEAIGKELAPDEFAVDKDAAVSREVEGRLGIRHWFPERSPYRIALSPSERQSGAWSLMFEHCHRARLSRHAKAEPETRYRAGLWIKLNEGKGAYTVTVDARLKDGTFPVLASIPVRGRPGEWQQAFADITTPPGATLLMLRLFVNGQEADARCWVDGLLIGQYPR